MTEYLVTRVIRRYSANPHEGITHLGGAARYSTVTDLARLRG